MSSPAPPADHERPSPALPDRTTVPALPGGNGSPDTDSNSSAAEEESSGNDSSSSSSSSSSRAPLTSRANSYPYSQPSRNTDSHGHGRPRHHGRLESSTERDKDQRIAQLEREMAVMEAECTRKVADTASLWQARLARQQQQAAQSEAALRRLHDERDELRQQVRGLKERVSTATRADCLAASDEVFSDGMARLANGLQNWVIVHFRRSKLTNQTDELDRLVPAHEALRHSGRLYLLQSVVSRLLVEHVFDAYYVGLSSDQATLLCEAETSLSSFAGSAEPVNQWRALTLAIVNTDAAQRLQAETARVTIDVIARVNGMLNAAIDAQPSEERDQALRALVSAAIDLSRLLVAQRAVFRVFMPNVVPHQRLPFDTATMEDIGGEEDDGDGLAQREVACVTFPGIIKRGDEAGAHLQFRNIIFKARVLCTPP